MAAGIYDITIEQGSTFTFQATLNDPLGAPVDLTGYQGRGQVKLKATDSAPLAAFTVTVTEPLAGKVKIILSAEASTAIKTSGTSYKEKLSAVYDIELYSDTNVIRLLNGKALISPEVTK